MPLDKFEIPPDQDGYTFENKNDVVSVELDGGFARLRKDIEHSAGVVTCQWKFDQGQYQFFKAFYNTKLNKASLPFLIDLIVDQPYVEEYEAKFVAGSVKTKTIKGLMTIVSAKMQVIPIKNTVMDEMLFLLGSRESGYGFINTLEQFANYGIDAHV